MITSPVEKKYEDGEVIIKEGSMGEDVFVIKSGGVEISRRISSSKLVIEVLRSGDIFGEILFPQKTKAVSSARALGATILYLIDKKKIRKEIKGLPVDLQIILEALMLRLKKTAETAFENLSRKNPRVNKRLPIVFLDGDVLHKAYAENISSGGLLIKTHHIVQKGEKLRARLHLPGLREAMRIDCKVAWAGNPQEKSGPRATTGIGVQFLDMEESDRELINKYVEAVRLISR